MNSDMKKRGLGRGLDALFRDARAEETAAVQPKVIKRADEMVAESQKIIQAAAPTVSGGSNMPRKLPVDKLKPGTFQPRRAFSDEALENLAGSISAHGVLQPLLVRPVAGGLYEIIAGERRWRAAQKAQVHDVPVIIRDMTDKEVLEVGLIENLQREDLTALEEAEGYQRLIDEFKHTQEALAHSLGKSRSHIANTLRLVKLPPRVKTLIQSGALTAGHARALINAASPEELANIVVKRGLSVRQTEKLAQQAGGTTKKTTGKKPAFIKKDVDVLALEEKMTSLLGLKVSIDGAGASGKIIIEYKTLEQLDGVLERLSRAR